MPESQIKKRAKVIRYYCKTNRPKNEKDLKRFAAAIVGRRWLDHQVCKVHHTPWDLVHDTYFAVADRIFGGGPRGGYKTKSLGLVNAMEMLSLPEIQLAHAGGTKKQAARAYKWTNSFLTSRAVIETGLVDPDKLHKEEMNLPNGSKLELFTATRSGVQGVHVQRLKLDEVDDERFSEEIFEDAKMACGSFGGYKRCTTYTSARRFRDWNVQKIMSLPKYSDVRKLVWCYLESTERCPVERHGEENDSFHVMDILDHEAPPVRITAFKNCRSCALSPDCRGMAARANGWEKLTDAIKDFKSMDVETWLMQKRFVRIRESAGRKVFGLFSETSNVRPVKLDPNEPIRFMVDFGGAGEGVGAGKTAVLFYQEVSGYVSVRSEYIGEEGDPDIDVPEVERILDEQYEGFEIGRAAGDSQQPVLIREWNKRARKFHIEPCKKLGTKIEMVKALSSMLQPIGGMPRYVIHPDCHVHIKQLGLFKEKEKRSDSDSPRKNPYEDKKIDTVDCGTYIAVEAEDGFSEPRVWVVDVETGHIVMAGRGAGIPDDDEMSIQEIYEEEMKFRMGKMIFGDD